MALRDLEGFEAQSNLVWDLVAGLPTIETSVTRGYWSGASVHVGVTGEPRRSIPGPAASDLYFGFGVRLDDVTTILFRTVDSAGSTLMRLFLNGAGNIEAQRSTTVIATGTKVLSINRWYFIEVRFVIHDTNGIVVVKVDEVEDINSTGLDTKPGTTTDMVGWHPGRNGYIDDFYVDDSKFHGDNGVAGLLVNGDGDTTQLSRFGAAANWQSVDEVPHDSDTTYNYSSTVGQYDLYNIESLDAALTDVKGVKVQAFAKKNDAGAASVALGVKYDSNGDDVADTESWGSDQALSTGYALHERLMEQDPGATGWTQAEVNVLQVGVKAR